MLDLRLVFAKTGKIRFISHLDLQRVFQRSFARAQLPLRFSEGFNPHAKMSFALPLTVGTASRCELLDFSLTEDVALTCVLDRIKRELTEETALTCVLDRIKKAVPEGLEVLAVLTERRPVSEIAWISLSMTLHWRDKPGDLSAFDAKTPMIIKRKTKKGIADFDLAPHIRDADYHFRSDREAVLSIKVSAQNPTVSPEHIRLAAGADWALSERVALWDENMLAFIDGLC